MATGELSKLGRYELRRVLGKGAMGVVYEGFDPTLHRRVAVKTILKSVAIDAETAASYSARFVKEAQAVARLNHPHIVQVHDFGEENEVAYLVMEFIEGRELRAFFDSHERFPTDEVVRIMGELLGALDFAHERGVIHRDVKPANVMLDPQRGVKLADFGVARVQDSDRSAAGTMVGTPAFMSPEQIKGAKIDRRTDIFSAGVVLYQLLTGEQPFKGEGAWTVAKKIVEDDPPRPSSLAPIPAAFDAVVSKALAKLPPQRFANAKEFAAALRGIGSGAAPSVVPAPERPGKAETKASETELEFWRSIQNRDDLDELELYLEQFPNGAYTQLARLKVAKLRAPYEAARKEAEEKARAEAEAKEKARKEAEEQARKVAEAKARQEAEERARREAAEKARREAEEKARRAAEEKAKREAEERAKRDAEEKARREAAEKARREAEEKKRQAEALARLKAQEAARAKAAADAESTVAIAPEPTKRPYAVPMVLALVLVIAVAGYLITRKSAPPAPVQIAEKPAPPKAEEPKVDVEKIRREAEERVRREYAEKSAAEQAAMAKAAAEKAIAEKQAAAKAAGEKAAADKLAAEKAAADKSKLAAAEKLAAAQMATERAAAEKAAAEKIAAQKLAAEKAAAEKAAADKLAAEKTAAEKALAQKARLAPAGGPAMPSVGDRWVYEARDADRAERKYEVVVEVLSASSAGVRDVFRPANGPPVTMTHQAEHMLVGVAPGIASLSPYLGAFQALRIGENWTNLEYKRLWQCSSTTVLTCGANARVVGKERVSVRAGSFDAWKIVVSLNIRAFNTGGGELIYWYAEDAKRIVKYQSRVKYMDQTAVWSQPNVDLELVSYVPAGRAALKPEPEKPAASEKPAVVSEEALLERFVQRKGAANVSETEPPGSRGRANDPIPFGKNLYVNDRTCPSGQIKQVTGGSAARDIDREYACVSLSDDRVTGDKPRNPEPVAALKRTVPAPAKPGWPSVGDRWVYEAHDVDRPSNKFEITIEVLAVTASAIRDVFRPDKGSSTVLTHAAGAYLVGVLPGIASFSPYLPAFQELRGGERWPDVAFKQLWECSGRYFCTASAHVAGRERVSTRAGSYDAWKILVNLQIRGDKGTELGEFTYWFATEQKRIVKFQSRVGAGQLGLNSNWMEPNIDMELVSFRPASAAK